MIAIATLAACASRTGPTSSTPPAVPVSQMIMGPSRLSAQQLVAWFEGRQPRPAGAYAATAAVDALAIYYVEEGAAEGVTGDVAFVQSVVETGWFRFNGIVPASANNFAGLGATGSARAYEVFADARTGIRAQIQHLRAYADAMAVTCTMPPLRNPCVDTRFSLVVPKGKAPAWNQLGNGNWATASSYGETIVGLYREARNFSGTTTNFAIQARNSGGESSPRNAN